MENPTLARLRSSVTRLSGGAWLYEYGVSNLPPEPAPFDWPDAALSGTVDPGLTLLDRILTGDRPVASYGRLSATMMGGDYAGPFSTVRPGLAGPAMVPLPSAGVLLGGGLALLVWRRRQVGGRETRSNNG